MSLINIKEYCLTVQGQYVFTIMPVNIWLLYNRVQSNKISPAKSINQSNRALVYPILLTLGECRMTAASFTLSSTLRLHMQRVSHEMFGVSCQAGSRRPPDKEESGLKQSVTYCYMAWLHLPEAYTSVHTHWEIDTRKHWHRRAAVMHCLDCREETAWRSLSPRFIIPSPFLSLPFYGCQLCQVSTTLTYLIILVEPEREQRMRCEVERGRKKLGKRKG